MKAKLPDSEGDVVRDGVRTHYYVYGTSNRTVVLMPTWPIVHAEHWKAQVAYLSRHYRVITVDGRGNGASDRPDGASAYCNHEYVEDVVAVMDATHTEHAVIGGVSLGGHLAGMLAAAHPDRVDGALLISPSVPFGPSHPGRDPTRIVASIDRQDRLEGWDTFNVHFWRQNYETFVDFFIRQIFSESHSTKQIEDAIGWALETDGHTLANTMLGRISTEGDGEELYRQIRCPVLVVHGDEDRVVPFGKGAAVAELTGGQLLTIIGGGHCPQSREPVKINLLLRDFADRLTRRSPKRLRWTRGITKERRALYLSSPIGLGHARRDLAIARELRALRPDLQIDWLAQHPVTTFLQDAGEAVHPASHLLVSESAHIEHECGEHDLRCFQALRRMDEIMVANFHLFQEAVEEQPYDLVIADEAWDVDHFWHEHPELKRAPLAWFTDFVGFLPIDDGAEADLTADYNAEMIGHVERHPRVRDLSVFVGDPEDIVPDTFGHGLPTIRDWTEDHFKFPGYVSGFDPQAIGDPGELRTEFGYGPGERVCLVTVGGSATGVALLKRVIQAFPAAKRLVPELRMEVVAGPRIDPSTIPACDGVSLHSYVADLHKRLAVCDLAVVQGGLTTCMELTACKRPFLYFPLKNHFEQTFHVAHRLDRYRAGRRMSYDEADPDAIANAIAQELTQGPAYLDVQTDGAARSARLLAELF